MRTYLTIAGAEYVVDYSYDITSPGAPEQGPSYASGGQPAEPFEWEPTFIALAKDLGGGEISTVECPKWLQTEIETWLYEDSDGNIYAAIEMAEADKVAEYFDRRDEAR